MGYIHRDLKPANVVIGSDVSEEHFVYLIDFGLAKKESSSPPAAPADWTKQAAGRGPVPPGAVPTEDERASVVDSKTGRKRTAMQTLQIYMDEE